MKTILLTFWGMNFVTFGFGFCHFWFTKTKSSLSSRMSLEGDLWAKNLDTVLNDALTGTKKSEGALNSLKSFFIKKLEEKLLPFSDSKKYESVASSQVYQWMNYRYVKLLEYAENGEISENNLYFDILAELYQTDEEKLPVKALVALYFKSEGNIDNSILADEFLQNAIYSHALSLVDDNLDIAINILTTQLIKPNPSHVFTELFFKTISKNLTDEQTHRLLRSFSHVVNRVDDKLILYNYLEKKLKSDPITASLAVPYIVDVSVTRSVDYNEFYDVVYHAISPESLSIPGRSSFFDTLGRTVTSHSIPAQTQIAYAIKLSRMLPHVSPDVQLDVLSVIQSLSRAHENVLELLTPKDTQIANVDGEISDVTPQTLWEVLTLKSSSVPAVAEAARTIGQANVPPEYESFDLMQALKTSRGKPSAKNPSSNWLGNLDKSVWL